MTHTETESKFELSPQDFRSLLQQATVRTCTDQLNVYYDSGDALSRRAATFRFRLAGEVRMTLKVPLRTQGAKRESVEIEDVVSDHRWRARTVDVQRDLPLEFSAPLSELGVWYLERVGCMRTRRRVIDLGDGLVAEADEVRLPNGLRFFEVEVEESRPDVHARVALRVCTLAPSARPSLLSKYERFQDALRMGRPSAKERWSVSHAFPPRASSAYKPHPDAEARVRSAKAAIRALLPLDLYPSHKRELLSACLWKLIEAESRGKYNLRYQTEAALDAPSKERQHEHVVERRKTVDALLTEPYRVDEILAGVVACTVTKEEHRRLTKVSRERPELEGWERYRAAGVVVLDLVTGRERTAS